MPDQVNLIWQQAPESSQLSSAPQRLSRPLIPFVKIKGGCADVLCIIGLLTLVFLKSWKNNENLCAYD